MLFQSLPVTPCHPPASLHHTLGGNSGSRGLGWGSLASVLGPQFSLLANGDTELSSCADELGSPEGEPSCLRGVLAAVFPEPPAVSWDSLEFLFFGLCLQGRSMGLFT